MPRSNDDVERALLEFADLLAIVGDDPYKPRAYEKAARAVGGYPEDLRGSDERGVLAIPGVGKSIAAKVSEFLRTGTFHELEALREPGACGRSGDDGDPGVRAEEGDGGLPRARHRIGRRARGRGGTR